MPDYKIVDAFARVMRTQFEANESIGGFRVIRPNLMDNYFAWLRENVDSLEKAVKGEIDPGDTGQDQLIEIAARAADTANLAAIIAMNAGALKFLPEDME